jgi:hypothetical protein
MDEVVPGTQCGSSKVEQIMRNIAIVIGKCGHNKQIFGIRFQRDAQNLWLATWAFAIKELIAQREGYAATKLDGRFIFDERFPGCPYCKAKSFFCCECGKLACCDVKLAVVDCPWCGIHGRITGDATSLTGGGDV